MKALEYLRKDHRCLRVLFARFARARGRRRTQAALFERLRLEIRAHGLIEQEVFYPALRRAGSQESGDLIHEARVEHQVVEAILDELATMDAEDAGFEEKLELLRENLESHVDEEEQEIFREARRYFSAAELGALGQEMEELKRSLVAGRQG